MSAWERVDETRKAGQHAELERAGRRLAECVVDAASTVFVLESPGRCDSAWRHRPSSPSKVQVCYQMVYIYSNGKQRCALCAQENSKKDGARRVDVHSITS
jgi:hypothetical protein